MAFDMFLKIDGPLIKGEARDAKHKDEFDVLAWSWGLSNSGNAQVGGGAGAGKVNVQDISITKYIDSGTPDLVLSTADGSHHKKATLTVRKAGKEPIEYLKIHMTDVLITSLSTGGSDGQDRLTENLTLNFAEYEIEYTPQKQDGTAGASKKTGWNIATNVKK